MSQMCQCRIRPRYPYQRYKCSPYMRVIIRRKINQRIAAPNRLRKSLRPSMQLLHVRRRRHRVRRCNDYGRRILKFNYRRLSWPDARRTYHLNAICHGFRTYSWYVNARHRRETRHSWPRRKTIRQRMQYLRRARARRVQKLHQYRQCKTNRLSHHCGPANRLSED